MDVFGAISERRSIRKFSAGEIPREHIDKILLAGTEAPSAKNRQPWKFIVVTEKDRAAMLQEMKRGIDNTKINGGLLPGFTQYIGGAEHTMAIMGQAPVTVFIFNTEENYLWDDADVQQKLFDIANIQSIGAAIQNMLLAATGLGIGSLWICDVFFAYKEICGWLGEENQMIAAVSFGYPDESPGPRPRKGIGDITVWR